jgi:hypothetical protein
MVLTRSESKAISVNPKIEKAKSVRVKRKAMYVQSKSESAKSGRVKRKAMYVQSKSESAKSGRVKRKAMYVKSESESKLDTKSKSKSELEQRHKEFNFWYDLRASFIFCKHYQPTLHPGCGFFGNEEETAARLNMEVKKASAAWLKAGFVKN